MLAAEGTERERIDTAAVAAALAGPRRAEVEFADGTVASVFRVGALAEGDAALLCLRALVDLSDPEREALDQTARFLTVELARRAALHAIESRFAGELLEMLYDAGAPRARAAGAAALVRDRRRRPLAVLSIAFADGEPTAPGLSDVCWRACWCAGASRASCPRAPTTRSRSSAGPGDDLEVAPRDELVEARRPRVAGAARGARHRAASRPASTSCGAACWRRARRAGSRSGAGADRR